MKQYRNEWKYIVHEKDIAVIQERLNAVMEKDIHGDPSGMYSVHSVYFDDHTDSCAKKNEAGVSERYKYRIRYYGSDPHTLHLERKEKLMGMCHKDSAPVTLQEYECLMNGDVTDLFWNTDNQLIREFCIHIMNRRFTPKAVVDYERIAFAEPLTNVRITFDKNISVSDHTDEFLSGSYTRYPLQHAGCHILEVKFDEILPGYLKNIITTRELIQSAFSKYYLGRLVLQNINR